MPKRLVNAGSAGKRFSLSPPFQTFAMIGLLLPLLLAVAPPTFAKDGGLHSIAPYRDGIVLLAFRDGTLPAQQKAILSSVGAREMKRIGVGVHVVVVKHGHVFTAIHSLQTHQAIQYAEPDYLQTVSAGSLPTDTLIGFQWAVHNTGQTVNGSSGTSGADEKSPLAWSITTGTNSVVIATLDTGVQYSHPDLYTNMWNNPGGIGGCAAGTHGYNVLNSSCDPMDDDNAYSGHGTHVSGIMGAVGNNAAGTVGVNWTTSILGVKWVNSAGTGATSDLITAMDWIVSAKQSGINIRVANDSQTWPGTAFSQSLSDEIDLLGSNDILFVTAAGNTGQNNDNLPRYPCSYNRPLMLCVAASDQDDQLWGSSNYGTNSVQLAAPGVNIYSTLRTGNYGYISGGSMAAPQVSGTAALILSLGYQPVSNLRSMILNGVDVLSSLSGFVSTSGRLNVCKAVPGCSTATSGMPANTTLPVVTSLPVQGHPLGASTGIWSGLPTSYAYQWSRCSASGSNCAAIPGATGQTYALLAAADVGATLAVKVSGSNSNGSASAQSNPSAVVQPATSSGTLSSSIVSGSNITGSIPWTITSSRSEQFMQFYIDGVLNQTDSIAPYTFNGSTTGLLSAASITNGPHVLGARALYTDNRTYDFYGETVTVANPPANTALPTISGTVVPYQTISSSNGSWAPNSPPTGFTYQWEHCDSTGLHCANISGANSSSYLLSPGDTTFTMRSNVTASNSFGSTSAVSAQTIVVPPPPLTITTTSLPGAITNTFYSTTVTAIGGVPPFTWSISTGSLPAGFSIAPTTGVITGMTAITGTINFTVAITDSRPVVVTKPLSISTTPPLVVTTTSLPAGTQLASYNSVLAATGGTPPYTWSITTGALPNGFTLAPSTGVISGVSTIAGISNFTVLATDANSLTYNQPLSLSVNGLLGGPSGIGLVQANSAEGSGVGSLSAAFPISNTAGNLIVAFVRMSSSSQTVSFSDTAGNAYLQAVAQVQNTDGSQSQLFYAKNILGASANKVTAQFSSANNHPWLAVYEFSGLSTTSPLDQISAAQNISSTPNSGATPTTTKANELIFGGFGLASTYRGTQTAGSGFTLLETDTSTSPGATEVMLATSPGSFAASFTLSSSPYWSAVVATFAGAGPVVTTTTLPSGTQNAAYNQTLAANGGTQPYTWSIASGALPAGLLLSPSTGVISGAPTGGTGTSNFTVQVTDSNSVPGTMPLTLAVVAPPAVTTTALPNGTQNVAYTTTLAATGGTTPYTWSISTGSLPSGLTLAPSTGMISGTPSSPTTASFTVQVTDVNSQTATQLLSLTVVPPPSVTTTSLTNGTQTAAYTTTLAATGGTTPYTWSISKGSLPAGLALAPGTGVISGTPTSAATTNFTVRVTDANSQKATQALSLTVVPAPSVTTSSLQNGTQNAAYTATLAATGGTSPYSWSISTGSLPNGLALAPSTGIISGTPTATGPNSFTVQVMDANSISATKSLNLTVVLPPSVTTVSFPNATQNGPYTTTLAATGGTTPYTWSISTGSLPAGLSLAPGTGVISGTPTTAAIANFTVQVTDVNSQAATQPLSLTVAPPPSVTTSSLPNATQNAAYTTTLAATAGVTPYTWSISTGTLPAGLTLAPGTGVISGTPTSAATTNFTVRVTDANSQKATQPLSLTVVPAPSVTTATLPNATQNAVYSATLAATGGTTPYTWSISTGNLPNGLALAPSTGIISGTPTSTGPNTFTVQVTDANSISATKSLNLTVVLPPSVTTVSFPNATQNGPYTTTLAATGGTTPYTWSISTGSLPAGLSLAPGTGVISGTPTTAAIANFTVQVTDVNSQAATQPLSLTVATPPSVTTSSLPNATQNAAYTTTLAATAGVIPYTWSISTGTLPAGLTLAPGTGVISGTPTSAATTNFTVQVTDANSVKATQPLSLTVVPAPGVTTASLPNGTLNAAYTTTLAATGGTTPYTWSISTGNLPNGLALAPSTGIISGTPTATGPNNFTVQVTDANLQAATKPFTLTVVLPPTITTASLPSGTQNVNYSATFAATGGTTPYTWTISVGSLPAGLSLAPSTGVISGKPTAPGTTNFTVQVTDATSQTAAQPLSITIAPPPLTVTTSSLPNGTQNAAYNATLAAIGGTAPYTWSISVGSLPNGLVLAPGTGTITGAPTAPGTTNFTVQVTDVNSLTATQALSLTVVPPPSVTTTTLPNGTQSAAYSTTLAATGGTTPYSWSVTAGALPAGLTLASSTGVISGAPIGAGTSNFSVQVTDANSVKATQALSLTVVPPSLIVTTTSLPSGTNNAAYNATLAATGGTTPYTWSVSVGALPAGLTLTPGTGVISGTPTVTGNTSFTVQVTDSSAQLATKNLSITVTAPSSATFVQVANNLSTAAGQTSISVNIASTVGHLLVAFVREGANATDNFTVSDSGGNIWTQTASGYVSAGSSHRAAMFYSFTTHADTRVTANFTTGGGVAPTTISVMEFSGPTAADGSVNSFRIPASSLASGTLTTTQSIDVLIYAVGSGGNQASWTAGSGFTIPNNNVAPGGNGSNARSGMQYQITAAPFNATTSMSDGGAGASMLGVFAAFSVSVSGGPSITTVSLPGATQNVSYTTALAATGGTTPYTWSVSVGALPAGWTLAPSTGVISGTPTATGTSNFTVQVTDTNSVTATKPLGLSVAPPPAITTASLANGTQNAAYNATLAATGGTTPYTWTVSVGALPAGLTLAPGTGIISGKPTGTGTTNFTVQVADVNSQTATQPLSITVLPPPLTVTTTTLPNGTQNAPYNATLAAIGGTAPYTWSISVGSLPNGLVLAPGTGAITGAPTAPGTTSFTVQVTDVNSLTATQALSLTVVPPPSVTTTTLPNGTQSAAYSSTLAATGGTTPYSWSVTVGALPAGLTLASSTGVISGAPTGAGTTSFTVQVSDANSQKAAQALSLIVVAAPTVSTTSLPNGTQTQAYTTTLAATGGAAPYTWSISTGSLPAGLAIAPSTGVISGTPTGTGTSNFTVKVTDANSVSATKALSITIVPLPSVTTASLPNGTQNTAYTTALAATGGTTPYTWSISVGTLPPGLTLAPSTGVISGTPTATGTTSFTVQVADANLLTATKPLSITVSTSSGGGIGLVQQNAVQGSAVRSVSAAFPTTNTAGNLILAFVRMSTTSQTVTLADSAGNVYTQAVTQAQASDGSQVYLFYAKNSKGAANTVTATFSSTNNHPWLAVYEYKGLNTISPLDQTAHAQGSNNAPNSGATPATTSATELVFAATGLPAGYAGTETAGSGFALLQQDTSTSPAGNESLLTTVTGTYTGTFTLSSVANWSAIIATFKP